MSAPLNITQAADLVDLSIQKIFKKSSEPDQMFSKFTNIQKAEDYYVKDSGLSGLGEADFVDENAALISDVPVQTNKKTYTQSMFGAVITFTFKMWRFGIKKRELDDTVQELKTSINRKREKLCAERLDNGWSTSYSHSGQGGNKTITTTGGDGLAAFANNHTREDGGTNMNNEVYDGTTYNLPLDYAGIKAAYRTAGLMVDPRGNPYIPNLDTLVCKKNSAVHFKAMEVLGAITKGQIPESFDHDGAGVNAFKIIPVEYITNSGYWFMFDSSRALKPKEGFQFVETQGAMIDPVNVVYKTKEIQTSVTAMWDNGHNDVTRSWVGSKGDSSAG